MNEKKKIILTIDDQKLPGFEGDTILDICRANSIYVPTLCYLEGLSSVGACRLCVVEIDGERRINPACTYPARDGLVVRTHTPKLEKYRRQILELIFTERNHFCFFCAASGDCELQALAYKYQIDHMRYSYAFPKLATDTLNDYIVIDHNRCILCGRCVRTCKEVVANRTLDFGGRGWRTMITADLNQSLGESSCISCGACVQSCPTGAIFSKVSAYRGRTSECNIIQSACSICGVGCEIEALIKDNNLIRIDGVKHNGKTGQLCVKGRFQQINTEAVRIKSPSYKYKSDAMKTASWDPVFDLAADKIKEYKSKYGPDSIAAYVSTTLPNETLKDFSNFIHNKVGSNNLDTLDGDIYRILSKGIKTFSNNEHGFEIESKLESILHADCILTIGCDPLESHPVAGSYILRACDQNKAHLILIGKHQNMLNARADLRLNPNAGSEQELISALIKLITPASRHSSSKAAHATGLDASIMKKAAELLGNSKKPVIIYGGDLLKENNFKLVAQILELAKTMNKGNLGVISLKPRGNSRGAWDMGIAKTDDAIKGKPKLVYLLLGDDIIDENQIEKAKQAEFLIVQASYRSPVTEYAHVLLPSPIWAEREGSYISLDGNKTKTSCLLKSPPNSMEDRKIIAEIAKRL